MINMTHSDWYLQPVENSRPSLETQVIEENWLTRNEARLYAYEQLDL